MLNRRSHTTLAEESPAFRSDPNHWVFVAGLFFLLFAYWIFARYIERIDVLAQATIWWEANLAILPLSPTLIGVAELFFPKVLRHFLPVIIGWWLAYRATVDTVQTLYDLPDRVTARTFLNYLRTMQVPKKAEEVSAQTLAEKRQQSVLLRVGGPGRIQIPAGNVAVTEWNGRSSRVLGPGKHLLGRFEYVHAILDLNEQERVFNNIPLITKDGLEIEADIRITFRLSTGSEPITRSQPYPYDEEAIRVAAYTQTVLADKTVTIWEDIPYILTKSILTKIIGKYQLNEILYPEASVREPYLTIQNDLERQVRASLSNSGIDLTGIHINRVQLPPAVAESYIHYWRAYWQIQTRISQADGQAAAFEEVEIARAEAEMTMIQAIVEGIKRAQQDGHANPMREVLALRMVEALEKIAEQSQAFTPASRQLLPRIANLRYQLASGESLIEDVDNT